MDETLNYRVFPGRHWRSLLPNNPLEQRMREIQRRTRAVGAFPDGNSVMVHDGRAPAGIYPKANKARNAIWI
ncbi:MAG: transposase [Puniceicoccales bacterium]|nr:transposase [Puniceicoccales bacterium]